MPASASRRLLALAASGLAGALLVVNGERLLSALYTKYSHELYEAGHPAQAFRAGLHAAAVAPWRNEAYLAQLRADPRPREYALKATEGALRWSPADPYLWAGRARVLMEQGNFGNPLALALGSIEQLAPTGPRFHQTNALYGLKYWHRGNPEVRQHWLFSIRYVLKTTPKRYLRSLAHHGQAERFCWTVGPDLDLDAWCDLHLKE